MKNCWDIPRNFNTNVPLILPRLHSCLFLVIVLRVFFLSLFNLKLDELKMRFCSILFLSLSRSKIVV